MTHALPNPHPDDFATKFDALIESGFVDAQWENGTSENGREWIALSVPEYGISISGTKSKGNRERMIRQAYAAIVQKTALRKRREAYEIEYGLEADRFSGEQPVD